MEITSEQVMERDCQRLNEVKGKLKDYDCDWCKNKGVIYAVKDGYIVAQRCNCMMVRENVVRVRESGLESLLEKNTFDAYIAQEPWQVKIKKAALDFLEDCENNWFFIGGQVGAGKTHICAALVGELMNRGYASKYMCWKEESTQIKSLITDRDSYEPLMYGLKNMPVLYIDDFFKTSLTDKGEKVKPTQGDINLAFEILSYRYNNGKITVISSEMTVDEIISCDEAIGSRIFQKTKNYGFDLAKDQNKNQRLKE